MQVQEPGVAPSSQIFFLSDDAPHPKLFLYPLCVGLYECSGDYQVNRINYDSFLLLYVIEGSMYVEQDAPCTVHAGEFALIDCYRPHVYGSRDGCRFLWVHFDGVQARDYYDYILKMQTGNPMIAADQPYAYRYLSRLYTVISDHRPMDPAQISKYLVNILTEFMYSPSLSVSGFDSHLEEARIFINENLHRQLSLEQMAAEAHLSVYHFTRRFKETFGFTPHEYLIKVRLNAACFYLVSSSSPVKEIAFKCGFSSNSAFCNCFRKNIGCTPAEYRSAHLSQ